MTLIHGDCRKELKKIASRSTDALITDLLYPEVSREYGRITEKEWHVLMTMVVILQPISEKVGKMRLWLVQNAYWWAVDQWSLGYEWSERREFRTLGGQLNQAHRQLMAD